MSSKRLLDDDSSPPERKKAKLQLKSLFKIDRSIPPAATPRFLNGALRITRTPGRARQSTLNTIRIPDIIARDHLNAAFIHSFFIGNDDFFQFLPLKEPPNDMHLTKLIQSTIQVHEPSSTRYRPECKIYISRDLNQDILYTESVKQEAAVKDVSAITVEEHARVCAILKKQYHDRYAFHALYPFKKGGCSHSKVMVLVYSQFLRVVITSSNLMASDLEDGDNHYFIQDFLRLDAKTTYFETDFERDLWNHLQTLACPADFVTSYRGAFDFSRAKAHLVSSQPSPKNQSHHYGQARLRRITQKIVGSNNVSFEICCGSLGRFNERWLTEMLKSLGNGRQHPGLPLKVVFPTRGNIHASTPGEQGASNISSHIIWRDLDEGYKAKLREVFYQYNSKDHGSLFHMKLMLALHPQNPSALPHYIYVGSANFSSGAWGNIEVKSDTPSRVTGIMNNECGVLIEGRHLLDMLEPATSSWEDIIPYVRPCKSTKYSDNDWPWVTQAFSRHKEDPSAGTSQTEELLSLMKFALEHGLVSGELTQTSSNRGRRHSNLSNADHERIRTWTF